MQIYSTLGNIWICLNNEYENYFITKRFFVCFKKFSVYKIVKFFIEIGVHPYNVVKDQFSDLSLTRLATLAEEDHCFAVGECGTIHKKTIL